MTCATLKSAPSLVIKWIAAALSVEVVQPLNETFMLELISWRYKMTCAESPYWPFWIVCLGFLSKSSSFFIFVTHWSCASRCGRLMQAETIFCPYISFSRRWAIIWAFLFRRRLTAKASRFSMESYAWSWTRSETLSSSTIVSSSKALTNQNAICQLTKNFAAKQSLNITYCW